MKDFLIKNVHLVIIIYAAYNAFQMYEQKEADLEVSNAILDRSQAKLEKSKSSIKRIDKYQKNLNESEKKFQIVVDKLKQIQRQLPSEINDTEVQRTLASIATDLKMIDMDTKAKQEVLSPNKFYFAKDYEYTAKGTFLQGLIFLERLENLSRDGRILNVKSVDMSLDPSSNAKSRFKVLSLKTVVESYRYNPNYRVTE